MEDISLSRLTWSVGRSEQYLTDLCGNIDRHYQRTTREKKGGGQRIIHEPSDRLSASQEEIHEAFLERSEWPDWLFGAGDGKGQRKNAETHLGLNHHFVTDILDFYPSVSNQEVYEVFDKDLGLTPDAARIATRLTTYRGGLPQGTTTSPRLADLAFLDIDRSLVSFCEPRGIEYTRYADDLTFSAGHSFKSEIPEIKSIVGKGDFRLHEGEKTGYKKGLIEVTGVVVTNNRLFAPPRLKNRLDEIDPESNEWEGTFGYVQYIEPDFEVTEIEEAEPIGPR